MVDDTGFDGLNSLLMLANGPSPTPVWSCGTSAHSLTTGIGLWPCSNQSYYLCSFAPTLVLRVRKMKDYGKTESVSILPGSMRQGCWGGVSPPRPSVFGMEAVSVSFTQLGGNLSITGKNKANEQGETEVREEGDKEFDNILWASENNCAGSKLPECPKAEIVLFVTAPSIPGMY